MPHVGEKQNKLKLLCTAEEYNVVQTIRMKQLGTIS